MPSESELEQKLQSIIFPDLEKGRKDFDVDHTKAVVIKLKEILSHSPSLKLDETVLLIAAYAHDWGYADIYGGKELGNYGDMITKKEAHMKIGAQKARNLLSDPFFGFLTDVQKEHTVKLVAHHDKLKELNDTDELVLMEADTLGSLDTTLVTPTITPEENDRFLRGTENSRLPKFITDYGKREALRLIEQRKAYYVRHFSLLRQA